VRRLALIAIVVAACSKRPDGAGLDVRVIVQPGVKATCVSIAAQKTGGGPEKESNLAPRKAELGFGIAAGDGLDGEIRIVARGWLGDCAGQPSLNAESAPVVATLGPGVPKEPVTLELTGALDDADQDGWRGGDAGTDCNDANASVHPMADELCTNGLDDDCNGKGDCLDTPRCDGVSCDDGRTCSLVDQCSMGRCIGISATCTTPAGPCFRLPGQCLDDGGCSYAVALGAACDGGVCASNGTCVAPGSELDCTNGLDDNMRDGADCADPTCLMQACSDGQACTTGDTCLAPNSCVGTARTCPGAPSACHDAGVCDPTSGACVFPVAAGALCSDGNLCTVMDRCQADAGCAGQPMACNSPPLPECRIRPGVCVPDSGICVYEIDAGAACDDSNPCTNMDTCTDAGFCQGSTFACPPPPECHTPGTCQMDAGCGYAPATGGTCGDGGFCVAGACQGLQTFNYVPSNFTVAQVPSWSPPVRIQVGCDPGFNSNGGGSFDFTCMQTMPTPVAVTLADGRPALVLGFGGLVVDPFARFTFRGDKPVILAVRSDAVISGTLHASSVRAGMSDKNGPGANYLMCGNGNGGNGSFSSSRGAGGGGGAFGSNGSAGANAGGQGSGFGVAGVANGTATLVPLRGGCQGGNGGGEMNRGSGGGALQVSAAGTLTISGNVNASGSRGDGVSGGNDDHGGGGAGSGGAILLEGRRVVLSFTTQLLTNGGGGGEGSGQGIASFGLPGGDGSATDAIAAPGGRSINPVGGNGANGAAGQTDAGLFVAAGAVMASQQGMQGSGGGGGGVGRIRINASDGGCVIAGTFSGDVTRNAGCP